MKRRNALFLLVVFVIVVLIVHFFTYNKQNPELSIKSELEDFTPNVITTTTATVIFKDSLTNQLTSTSRLIAQIAHPSETRNVSNDTKAILLGSLDEFTKQCAEQLKEVVGEDVEIVDITKVEEIEPNVWDSYGVRALFTIESAIRFSSNVHITTPVVLFLDNNNTLLAVFSWPYPNPSKEELTTLANLGIGYYGVYIPLPDSYGVQVLTNAQKRMIADALEPIYKINIYVR